MPALPVTSPPRPRRHHLALGGVLLSTLTVPGFLNAQMETTVGVLAGTNSYDWQGGPQVGTIGSAEYTAKIGGFVGGAFGVRFSEKWGARLEAFYDYNRTLITAPDQLVSLQYVRFPLMGQFWLRFSPEHDNYLMISAGPTVGFNIGCSVADVGCDDLPTGELIAPSLTDYSLLGTIGFATGPAIFELRYNLGLRNINRIVNGPDLKTREYLVSVSYYFPLKRGGNWF